MKFYSYEYLKEHILSANIFQMIILIIFLGIIIFSVFMYFKSNGDSINIVEKASNKLGVPKDEIYITRSNDNNIGIVIKTKDWYYRVIKSDNTYMFERLNILNPDIELVEVKK